MDRNTFARLCFLLSELGGLTVKKYVGVEEHVSMFLSVLAHHKNMRMVKFDYHRFTQTGCLGALYDTYIDVQVSPTEKARYRTRKGRISTNVLVVCDREMRFIYFLSGWEGSAADYRVLRDAVCHTNGLKVPKGIQTTHLHRLFHI
ncbi:hypothetical protein ACS0TY_018873 [Phlomoides rotata]